MPRPIFAWAFAAVLLWLSGACAAASPTDGAPPVDGGLGGDGDDGYHGLLLDPLGPAPDFTMEDQHGGRFRLSDRDGKALLMFFGYTHCPDVCPMTLADYVQVRERLGGLAGEVEFAFITVDPERDAPDVLAGYVGRFDESFYGLRPTGEGESLEGAKTAYGVYAEALRGGDGAGYLVAHTDNSFLIDPEGRLAVMFRTGAAPAEIAADIERLLG